MILMLNSYLNKYILECVKSCSTGLECQVLGVPKERIIKSECVSPTEWVQCPLGKLGEASI